MNRSSIWEKAMDEAGTLAAVLVQWEIEERAELQKEEIVTAIASAWTMVIEMASESRLSLDRECLAKIHRVLAEGRDSAEPGIFSEGDNPPGNWTDFQEAVEGFQEDDGIAGSCALILAMLYWGNHVKSFRFSLGWLVLNGLRLQEGLSPLRLTIHQFDILRETLGYAGPDCWDAERLRSAFGELEDSPDWK
jgi:hypothetical protein